MSLSFDPDDRLFKRWCEYYDDWECFPFIDFDAAVEIIQETERCEPFQQQCSIYSEDYKRCAFMKALLKEARKRYEITMASALKFYIECI